MTCSLPCHVLFKVLAIAYRKETFFTFQNIIINCLVPLNVLGEVCAIKRGGAGGEYNISEQQLFEALKMNYTGDSFICLQIHFFIKSSEEVKKRTCRGNNSSDQLNRA